MLRNRSSWLVFGCSLSLLVCVVTVILFGLKYSRENACQDGNKPLREFTAIVQANQHPELVKQSKQFADQYGFKFDVAYFDRHGQKLRVDLLRNDVEVIMSNPFNLEEFEVGFYNYDCIHPTTAADIVTLVDAYKASLSEISGIVIMDH